MPYDSLLIYAYGGPESMAEVPDFIRSVTGGRVSAERLAEVQTHYAMFGGVSPMNGAIREFMRLWRVEHPEVPVYFGACFAEPGLEKTLCQMVSDGRRNTLVLIPAPFVGYQAAYHEKLAAVRAGMDFCPELTFIPPFSEDPLFLNAQEKVISAGMTLPESFQESLPSVKNDAGSVVPVKTVLLFSVHSLPVSLAQRSGYEAAVRTAFEEVKARFPSVDSYLAWQSAAPGPEPWLEPKTTEMIREIAAKYGSRTRLLLIPFGFPFENMEVVYDLDVESRTLAESLRLEFLRVPTIGLMPEFRTMVFRFFQERSFS